MSKKEAESERKKQESDAVRLKMALSESAKEAKQTNPKQEKSLVDLTAAAKSLKDPWGGGSSGNPTKPEVADPFSVDTQNTASDPWSVSGPSASEASQLDPWSSTNSQATTQKKNKVKNGNNTNFYNKQHLIHNNDWIIK